MSEAALEQGPQRYWVRPLLGLVIGLCAATSLVAWLGISQKDLVAHLHGVQAEPLLLAAFGGMILMSLQTLRWWVVMRPVLAMSYAQAFRAVLVGFFFNVILPARGGDLLRVQYLGRRTGISRAKLLGTEIVDFWSDKWGWVAAFPIVCLLGEPPAWLFTALLFIGGAVIGVATVLALMASGIWRGGPSWLAKLREGFAASHWKRLLFVETLIAPLPWLWETLVIAVAGHALGLELTVMQAFAALTAFNIATAVPSPGNAGSFEAGGTLALIACGVPKETAFAFIFLYHLTQIVPGFIGGILVLVSEREMLFDPRRIFRFRPSDALPDVVAVEPDPG